MKQQKSALECFPPCIAGGCLPGTHTGQQAVEDLSCSGHINVTPRSPGASQAPQLSLGLSLSLSLMSTCTATLGPQKRGLEPWFSNSDQASLSSMKIILAYCS